MKKLILAFLALLLAASMLFACAETYPLTGGEKPSEGLELELNGDGTGCIVKGIGTCTDTEIVIPLNYNGLPVVEIANKAFSEQTQITKITVTGNVKTIGTRAFYGCSSLTEIVIPKSVTYIGTQIFYKANSLKTVYYGADYYDDENPLLNNASIEKVVFQGTYVGKTFLGANVKTVEISDSVTSIGDTAFYGCSGLTSVTIPDTVTSIGEEAFYNCTSLTSITIPDSVTIIDGYAFSGCSSLKSITIPDSVTNIGWFAFENCSSLTEINFTGTKEQWYSIDKFYNWDNNTPSYIVHCTDGDISK